MMFGRTAASRFAARSVGGWLVTVRGASSLIRNHHGRSSTERLTPNSVLRRNSTSVAGDGEARPGSRSDIANKHNSAESMPTTAKELPRQLYNVFATKHNRRSLSAARMLQTCLNNVERKTWYTDAQMSTEFLTKILWLSTNVWIISRRLLLEGEEGKKIQELLFDELWRETVRQMRGIDVDYMSIQKYLKQSQQHVLGTLCQYDHAYTLEGQRDRLDALAGALWRGIYSRNENMDEQVVKLMAEHVDSELDDVLELDADAFFGGCIDFGLPPPGIAPRGRKQQYEGANTGETSAYAMDRPAEAPALSPSCILDPDLGGDRKGRWRASLAESGKVYYWHTVTNQVQYEQPEGLDYVPAVMPKQQKDET